MIPKNLAPMDQYPVSMERPVPVKHPVRTTFQNELSALINRNSLENVSNTQDFVLAEYLVDCLEAFDKALNKRNSLGKERPCRG